MYDNQDELRHAIRVLGFGAMRLRFGLALLMCVLACRGETRSDDSFTLGFMPGVQEFIIHVMVSRGILDKHQLDPDMVETLSPASLHLMIAEGRVDVAFGGITSMAIARGRGKNVLVAAGVLSPVNAVFVHRDSPLRTLDELEGKKLGIFGGPGSTTFTFLAVIARRWFDLDLEEDVEIVTAAPVILASLLERGQIDAALMGSIESLKFQASGAYRVLLDLSDEYEKREGVSLAHVGVVTNEEFASVHPDILLGFLEAHRETIVFIREHPELWVEYGRRIGMESEDEIALLRSRMSSSLVTTWTPSEQQLQLEYLMLAQETLGKEVMADVPAGLFWKPNDSRR